MSEFDAFLEAGWNDHADRPAEVAERLAASLARVTAPESIVPYARLATHVYGEHLGQWRDGVALLERLRALPLAQGRDDVASALGRSIAALRYGAGDERALAALGAEDRIAALATASSALVGQKDCARGLAAYAAAIATAEGGLPSGSPAARALAVGGNNLAAALEEKGDRNADETRGMVSAAQSALKYWKLSGTWLEEERAEYRLAKSLLQAGDPATAAQAAQRCVAVCAANEAPAFERFFAVAVLALAQRAAGNAAASSEARAAAFAFYAQVPADDRRWCDDERRALG
jgi:hypothetical protein